jgi:hypothetical protein
MISWFIWVKREPAYHGYLPKPEHWVTPASREEFEGAIYTTNDPSKAQEFNSQEEAMTYIRDHVHPYLQPHCEPTTLR